MITASDARPLFESLRFLFASGIILALMTPATLSADPCRLETGEEAERLQQLIRSGSLIVEYCWFCDSGEPLPLRVRTVELRHTAPEKVRVQSWDEELSERYFALTALEQAERDGTGPLADFLQGTVDRDYSDTTGYLGPSDPYLLKEKKDRYAMLLRFVRQDYETQSWDELFINDHAADPRLLYVNTEGDRYRSVGVRVGCLMDNAPDQVVFRPLDRDPSLAAPPVPYVAVVTGQCYDGACPRDTWRTIDKTPLLAQAHDDARKIAVLEPGEQVVPVRTESHVIGSRLTAIRDHGKFFVDDIFYVLDSQAEGFHRVWHYGDVYIIDASDVDIAGRVDYCERDNSCWASGDSYAAETWWAKVRRADGEEGWVKAPLRKLDGVLRSD